MMLVLSLFTCKVALLSDLTKIKYNLFLDFG